MSLEWGAPRRTSRHIDAIESLIGAVLGDCGHDMGDDSHDADDLGDSQVCPDCCPLESCKSSEAVRPAPEGAPAGRFLPAGAAVDGGSLPYGQFPPTGDAVLPGAGAGVPVINSIVRNGTHNGSRGSTSTGGAVPDGSHIQTPDLSRREAQPRQGETGGPRMVPTASPSQEDNHE